MLQLLDICLPVFLHILLAQFYFCQVLTHFHSTYTVSESFDPTGFLRLTQLLSRAMGHPCWFCVF